MIKHRHTCPKCGYSFIPEIVTKTEKMFLEMMPTTVNTIKRETGKKLESISRHISNMLNKKLIEKVGTRKETPCPGVKRKVYTYALYNKRSNL